MLKQDHVNNQQLEKRKFIQNCLTDTIMPPEHKINNLGLFLKTGSLSHILFCNEAYEMIKEKPGVIMEFGVWYGNNQILFENLRAIHEPFNKLRKIIGFDTFDGYPEDKKTENDLKAINKGYLEKDIYDVSNYTDYLKNIIDFHQENNILPEKKINEIVIGKVEDTLLKYLNENKSTVIALIYLDLAIYKSTCFVLENILPYLIKGSVIIFDEFNHPDIVGDTIAFREILLKNNIDYEIKLSKFMREKTFLIIK
jgi:hypothetical protein